jgi:polyhydroxybutyrate depolymerase
MTHGRRHRAIALLGAALIAGCGAGAATSGAQSRAARADAAAGKPKVPQFTKPYPTVTPLLNCSAAQQAGRLAPIIHRGSSLPSGAAAPLLIALHGSGGTGPNMEGLTHFISLADQDGFVVVYPTSCGQEFPWYTNQDLPYLTSLIHHVVAGHTSGGRIDARRVYATGFSAGGLETWRLGCQDSKQITAIAVVSMVMFPRLFETCAPSHPLPELLIEGTEDSETYPGVPQALPSARQTTTRWRQLDGCPARARVHHLGSVTEQTWASCDQGTAVGFDVMYGASHDWPPVGADAPAYFPTSQVVWSFLSRFRMARATPK